MDIEELIKRECRYRNEDNDSGIHDRAYEKALRNSYEKFKHLTDIFVIKNELNNARDRFAQNLSRHVDVADCMVLNDMFDYRMDAANKKL